MIRNIQIVLHGNKTYEVINLDEIKILEDECDATLLEVQFPIEYENFSKRVDFMNPRGEKWTTSLYAPEDENNQYDDNFDKLNFSFTIPNAMAKRGELLIQFVAYLTRAGRPIVVPFQVMIATINRSILYATQQGKENPELVINAYEYSNQALALSREALTKTANSERAALESEKSAKSAENSAKEALERAENAESSAIDSNQRAINAEQSASESATSAANAEESARLADERATRAEQVSNEANTKSSNAVETSNDANSKSTTALDIVENLTVSSEEIDCTEHVSVAIQTNSSTKRKNVHFKVPAPKQGKSYRSCGEWVVDREYINDDYYIDTVSLHGCTYWCKITNSNQQPEPSAENETWGLLAIKGSDAGVTIVDTLESTNADHVLSAKQGNVLKELIASSITTAINNLIDNAPDGRKTLNLLSTAIDNIINNTTKIQANNGSVQLGQGTNNVADTLQFKDFQLLNSLGNIPMPRLLNSVYPVGSIYMSINNTNPQNFFGGTWVSWGIGRVPVGVDPNNGNFNSVEKTGGSSTHTLTPEQMPSHNHGISDPGHGHGFNSGVFRNNDGSGSSANVQKSGGNSNSSNPYISYPYVYGNTTGISINNSGGGQAHNNLQPYITCYMWKRTA